MRSTRPGPRMCRMRKPLFNILGRTIVPIGAAVLVLALGASVWIVSARERTNKRLYLEYEVYKALTALTDIVRFQALSPDDVKNVLGFGLYASDGRAIVQYGKAPASIPVSGQGMAPSRFTLGESSVILFRPLGGDLPGRRMMSGAERAGRMRGSMPSVPGNAGEVETAQPRMPAFSYIEISTIEFKKEEAVLITTALIASVALVGLYAVIVVMNRRYAVAQERMARDGELIELGQAARTIAHEIKNPLGVIRIQCGLLKRGADEATVAGLSVIDDEAMRLAGLADRIRSFLKSGDEGARLLHAGRYLDDFAARYADSLDFDLDIDADTLIRVDETRLTEALDNVVANALEADAGGKPRLEARIKSRRLCITVLDRGPGVAADVAARVFEPFFTTRERGSGLGLALAKKNIQAYGGSITYSDRPGGGASFSLCLPVSKQARDLPAG